MKKCELGTFLTILTAATLLLYAFFYHLITAVLGDRFAYLLFGVGYASMMLFVLVRKKLKTQKMALGWLVILVLSLIRNQRLESGSIIQTVYSCEVMLFAILMSCESRWSKKVEEFMTSLGLVHVFATLLFFITIPMGLYNQVMVPVYGVAPVGTEGGIMGFRAGLTSHNSTNGIYCSLTFLLLWFQYKNETSKKKKKILFLLMLLSLAALILSMKRAHLLFSLCAIAIQYCICSNKKDKHIKALIALVAVCIILFLVASLVPNMGGVLDRFFKDDDGDISSGRFAMWQLAFSLFANHPVFGIGWFGYRYEYARYFRLSSRYVYNDTHNIYLQLLCETGIIGALFVITFLFRVLARTIKYGKQASYSNSEDTVVQLSIAYQIFVLLVGLTGNPLYDVMFIFYVLICAMGMSMNANALQT